MIDKGFFKLNEFLNAVFSLKNEGKIMIKIVKIKLWLFCKFTTLKSLLVGSLSDKIMPYKVKNPLGKSGFIVENNKFVASYSHIAKILDKKIIANSLK